MIHKVPTRVIYMVRMTGEWRVQIMQGVPNMHLSSGHPVWAGLFGETFVFELLLLLKVVYYPHSCNF